MTSNPYFEIDQQILADNKGTSQIRRNLYHLCDMVGPRFVGTPGYRKAVDHMAQIFRGYNMDRVEREEFGLNVWRRGSKATVAIISPVARELPCHELPYSGSTPRGGAKAELVHIGKGTEGDFLALGDKVRGRMALCTGLSSHRSEIYKLCAARGAVAFLLTCPKPGGGFQTGSVCYNQQGAIPAFSISQESALLLQRLMDREPGLQLHVESDSICERDVSWNVVAELHGQDRPDEWVLMGGHLDSHDISPCAFDNGAGAVLVTETARLLSAHRLSLERSCRFVLFSAEEVGLLGSHHHAQVNTEQLKRTRFMLNADTPATGFPKGLFFHGIPSGEAFINELSQEFGEPLFFKSRYHCHSDHYPFILQGLPTAGMGGGPEGRKLESWYHMVGDTPEKVSLESLDAGAVFAARFLLRASNRKHWPFAHRSPAEVKALVEGEER